MADSTPQISDVPLLSCLEVNILSRFDASIFSISNLDELMDASICISDGE